jgi:glycine cleavage system H lipoate-binding protein
MIPNDLLTMYSAKAVEYLIAVTFLLLFMPFWSFVNKERALAPVAVAALGRLLDRVVEWFTVPSDLFFHPGHAWVRADDGNVVTVGMDDFAHKLVGGVSAISLPAVGSRLGQGEKGWSLLSGSKSIDMLSPVDGTVVAVNERAAGLPPTNGRDDPYREGWLLKVRAPRLSANTKQLLSGALARRWMEEVCDGLRARMSPDLGRVYQDGGLPIEGMARSMDPANWDQIAREFFLT